MYLNDEKGYGKEDEKEDEKWIKNEVTHCDFCDRYLCKSKIE